MDLICDKLDSDMVSDNSGVTLQRVALTYILSHDPGNESPHWHCLMISALINNPLTSGALASAALAWSQTSPLTIQAVILMALTSALYNDLAIAGAINVTYKCNSEMDCGSAWLWHGEIHSTGYKALLLGSICPANQVCHVIRLPWCILSNQVLAIFTA